MHLAKVQSAYFLSIMNIEIHRALIPAYYLSKIMGTSPYHLTRDGSGIIHCQTPKYQKISAFFKIIFLIFFLNPFKSHHLKIHTVSNVPVNLHIIEDSYSLACTCLFLLLCCWNNDKIFHFLKKVHTVNSTLRKYTIQTNYKILRLTVSIVTISGYFLLMFTIILDFIINYQYITSEWTVTTSIINAAIDYQMISFLLTIRTQFKSLNDNLRGMSNFLNAFRNSKETLFTRSVFRKGLEDVKNLYKCRTELHDAFKSLNHFYGLQCALKIPLYFLSSSCKVYYIFVHVIQCGCLDTKIFAEFMWLIFFLWSIFIIFLTCDSICNEVI